MSILEDCIVDVSYMCVFMSAHSTLRTRIRDAVASCFRCYYSIAHFTSRNRTFPISCHPMTNFSACTLLIDWFLDKYIIKHSVTSCYTSLGSGWLTSLIEIAKAHVALVTLVRSPSHLPMKCEGVVCRLFYCSSESYFV